MPLDDDEYSFLRSLLQSPGPSGFEGAAASVWRERAQAYGADVSNDVVGNSAAVFNQGGSLTIMLIGHLDEIGIIVHYVDDDGFLYFSPIGGWDSQVLVGQRICLLTRNGEVSGVVGRLPIHPIRTADREKAVRMTDLWIDIGATSRHDAERLVAVGDPGVIDAPIVQLANGRIASRSVDNRVGAFVVLEAARRYAESPATARVIALAATQEEIGRLGGGVVSGVNKHAPAVAIVVDVTFATDHHGAEKKALGDHRIGGGPVISRGGPLSPIVTKLLVTTAVEHGIAHTIQANPGATGTDADPIARAGAGIAVGLLSIPNRYMHSPNELVSLDDLDRAISLLAQFGRRVTTTTDFIDR